MEILHRNETSKKLRLLVSQEMQPTLELYAFLPLSVASSAGLTQLKQGHGLS